MIDSLNVRGYFPMGLREITSIRSIKILLKVPAWELFEEMN